MKKSEEFIWLNQQNIRIANQIKVISLLRNGPESCSSLAKVIGLSNTALEKVVDELYYNNLLIKAPNNYTEKKGKGRNPDLFKINDSYGVVAAIDLSGRDIIFCLADLANRIIIKDKIENVSYVTLDLLNQIIHRIKIMLSNEKIGNKKLLNICISSPGKIDKTTKRYIYAPRIENYENVNIYELFKNSFNVEVYIYNDVNMGLLGERAFGCVSRDIQNVYFAHIDITAGAALVLNGKMYVGSNGFAGEIADYKKIDSYSTNNMNGKLYTLTDIFIDIKEKCKNNPTHPFYGLDVLKLNEVCDLFLSNDKIVCQAVDKSARLNAIELLAIANLLDLDDIIIEGSILTFGEKYKQLIKKYYLEYDNNHNTAKIDFSTLNNESIILGTIYQGISMVFLKEFENMVIKRTNNEKYKIDEYFDTVL